MEKRKIKLDKSTCSLFELSIGSEFKSTTYQCYPIIRFCAPYDLTSLCDIIPIYFSCKSLIGRTFLKLTIEQLLFCIAMHTNHCFDVKEHTVH